MAEPTPSELLAILRAQDATLASVPPPVESKGSAEYPNKAAAAVVPANADGVKPPSTHSSLPASACIACGEHNDGGYEIEDGPGPFCSSCWLRLEDNFTPKAAPLPASIHPNPPNLSDAAEMLWVVLANVNGSDWTKQSAEWQKAAARWRDYYFASKPVRDESQTRVAPLMVQADLEHPAPAIQGAKSSEPLPASVPRYSVAELRASCHMTFNGGWHGNEDGMKAFHHGMDTVCNVIERDAPEFTSAAAYDALAAQLAEARTWVKDLQSGMYINCVYCGHRYGPKESTPVSMADVLKEHVEKCPQHPMSKLKVERDALAAQLARVEMERDGMVAPEERDQWKRVAEQVTAERDALTAHEGEPITLRAFQAMKTLTLLRELDQLKAHTHGFAYPEGQECQRCKREREIENLLAGKPK